MEDSMELINWTGAPPGEGGFLFLYRRGILLSLKESGYLTEEQYARAEELLRQRYPAGEEL